MLYPTDIKIERKSKIQQIKEKIINLKNDIKCEMKYLIFDRKNLGERIVVKLHI